MKAMETDNRKPERTKEEIWKERFDGMNVEELQDYLSGSSWLKKVWYFCFNPKYKGDEIATAVGTLARKKEERREALLERRSQRELSRGTKIYAGEVLVSFYDSWLPQEQKRVLEKILPKQVSGLEKVAGTYYQSVVETCLISPAHKRKGLRPQSAYVLLVEKGEEDEAIKQLETIAQISSAEYQYAFPK